MFDALEWKWIDNLQQIIQKTAAPKPSETSVRLGKCVES